MDAETLKRANEVAEKLRQYDRNLATFTRAKAEEDKPSVTFGERVKSWFLERRGPEDHQCGIKAELNDCGRAELIGYLKLDNEDMAAIREIMREKHDRLQAEFKELGGSHVD
jgi:hypothetical protein